MIPYYWIPAVSYSLDNMQFVPKAFTQGRDKFIEHEKNVMEDLNRGRIIRKQFRQCREDLYLPL